VRSGLAPAPRVRRLALLPALALVPLAVLAGCDGAENPSYPAEMRYPLRQDVLVLKPPKNTNLFPFAEPPGRLEESIARIPEIGEHDGKLADPKGLAPADRDALRKFLDEKFGTPANPKVALGDDDDAKGMIADLILDDATLAAGSKLYRRHCLQCHGVAGDGRGPTGPWVHPHPRDYRQGIFKFVSSDGPGDRKPRREDLHRTLTVGIEGTSMPSFALLADDNLKTIISYVIHLSIRGDVEFYITSHAIAAPAVPAEALDWAKGALESWSKSDKKPLKPKNSTPPPGNSQRLESIKRGYDWFTNSKVGNCVSCHFDYGRQAQFRYDAWGNLVRPNNLTNGVYRGGRRPIDLFWRIRGGINPCEMPKNEDEDKVWDLVNFVEALPYPDMLPDEVKEKVYPRHHAEKKVAER
jgi:mono/diheme cytochrome c family protein